MTLHVACAADSDYAVHSAAMLHSLLEHTAPDELTVHYLHGPGFSSRSRRLLQRMLAEAGATIVFHEVDESLVDGLPLKGPITIASWYRLLVPSVVDADRALWLDSDLIVVDDVAPLAEIELGGTLLAAVDDLLARHHQYLLRLGLIKEERYFNAGVMVLDLERIRREDKDTFLISETRRLAPWLFYLDQDAMNVVFAERWLRLHPRWNVTPAVMIPQLAAMLFEQEETEEALTRPAIRHYLGFNKPWSEHARPPDSWRYWKHREATPFA